ncbi:unnamed protein product [Ceratitis capitata]|uniref:(Mediterranean fruit fly) hypothetical protein n=1 Tax=Ceratitis capitata TaxID=7213 RepID=A0A811VIZ6_CERCA|nr:unnamed protein product [Ceratitis capitata]
MYVSQCTLTFSAIIPQTWRKTRQIKTNKRMKSKMFQQKPSSQQQKCTFSLINLKQFTLEMVVVVVLSFSNAHSTSISVLAHIYVHIYTLHCINLGAFVFGLR